MCNGTLPLVAKCLSVVSCFMLDNVYISGEEKQEMGLIFTM